MSRGGLSGAGFVVLSISTGGLDATALELEIPAPYGLVQTVGDTVGQAVSSAACGKSLWL